MWRHCVVTMIYSRYSLQVATDKFPLYPVDPAAFEFDLAVVSDVGRPLNQRPESDDLHESRTDLGLAQWNAKINKPCTLTPTANTACNVTRSQLL